MALLATLGPASAGARGGALPGGDAPTRIDIPLETRGDAFEENSRHGFEPPGHFR